MDRAERSAVLGGTPKADGGTAEMQRVRGLIPALRRVPVAFPTFESGFPEFPEYVVESWQAKFDVGANSYHLVIDRCRTQDWMVGDLFDRWPCLAGIGEFHMVKFDNVVNGVQGTPYDPTPKRDPLRERLRDDGLAELFSHVVTGIETFGVRHDVQLFVACAYRQPLERLYRSLLTCMEVAGYVSREFTPANEQTHFALVRSQGRHP